MIIRPAAAADIDDMAAVAAAAYRSGFAHILEAEVLAARDAAYFAQSFSVALPALRVAVQAGRIVAFAKVTAQHLDMLFTAPEAQGSGIGAALLASVEADGVTTLECFRDNHAARRFYQRHGWQLLREYSRDFLGKTRDFVWLEKKPDTTGR